MKQRTYDLTYSNFKTRVNAKTLKWQFVETPLYYEIFAVDGSVTYRTLVYKANAYSEILGIDQTTNDVDLNDFEANYKDVANDPVSTKLDTSYYDGRPSIRAESRPDGTRTYFTTVGDNTAIGDGNKWEWDFSNSDNDVPDTGDPDSPPTGFKRKRIDVTFADEVYPKEGTVYFHNAIKGSYVDFCTICPDQGYYLDRNDNPVQASGDTKVDHFVRQHPIQGSVPMGDELNTESATIDPVPAGYKFRLLVTVPDSDVASNGSIELEIFRLRTNLLPGETL